MADRASYENILIRADADTEIGSGHCMRCLALAQALHRRGVGATFIMSSPSPGIIHRFSTEQIDIIPITARRGSRSDAETVIDLYRKGGSKGIILDGYVFDAPYQKCLRDAGVSFLLIDDMGYGDDYHADFIVNQNLHAHGDMYRNRKPDTVLLLGSRFTLLRDEFVRMNIKNNITPSAVITVLVTMGGSDPDNVTLKVLQALKTIHDIPMSVKIIAGMSNPHVESLKKALDPICSPADGSSPTETHGMEILQNTGDMPRLMNWADIAVSAGGSTCWELAYMGVPSLVIVLADNQVPIADSLQKRGIARTLGWHGDLTGADIARELRHILGSPSERHRMSLRGKQIIDGCGADRVADTLLESWIPETVTHANRIHG